MRELAQGAEVSELDEGERAWNATVDDDGLIRARTTSGAFRPRGREARE